MQRDAACIPASAPAGKDKMKHEYVLVLSAQICTE